MPEEQAEHPVMGGAEKDPGVQLAHAPASMRVPAGHGTQAEPLALGTKPGWDAKGHPVALAPTPV